jgi:ketosteroid isomerase-like protein
MKKTMKVRMNNPVMIIPDAMQALQVLRASARERGVPSRTPHVRYSGRNSRKEDVMFRVSCISWPFLAVTVFTVLFFGVRISSSATPNDEAQIRTLERRFADAFRAKDVDGVMANYEHSGNLVFFDVVPRREYLGWDAYKKDWQGLFAAIDGPVTFEVNDFTVNVDGNLAYSYSFQHHIAKMKAGGLNDGTVRVTDVYRKSGGKWLIVQEHVSVPVDPQTGKADLQFRP